MLSFDILQYCKGLIISLEKYHALVEQSFHNALQQTKPYTLYPATWGFYLLEKTPPKRLFSTILEKPLSNVTAQSLLPDSKELTPKSMCLI